MNLFKKFYMEITMDSFLQELQKYPITIEDIFCEALNNICQAYMQLDESFYIRSGNEKLETLITRTLIQNVRITKKSFHYNISRENVIDDLSTIDGKEPRIDITILGNHFYQNNEIHIECKVLKDSTINNYINKNGVKSFLDNKYGNNQNFAGMIGYNISKFNTTEIVNKLNHYLLSNHNGTTVKEIELGSFCNNNGEIELNLSFKNQHENYMSTHLRSDNTNIDLIHLFFDYNNGSVRNFVSV